MFTTDNIVPTHSPFPLYKEMSHFSIKCNWPLHLQMAQCTEYEVFYLSPHHNLHICRNISQNVSRFHSLNINVIMQKMDTLFPLLCTFSLTPEYIACRSNVMKYSLLAYFDPFAAVIVIITDTSEMFISTGFRFMHYKHS